MALILHGVEEIIIDPNGDLTLRFYTTEGVGNAQFASAVGNTFTNGKVLATMLVSRSVMVNSSTFYKKKLAFGSVGAANAVIDIKDRKYRSAELWFRGFHGLTPSPHSLDLKIKGVWNVIEYGQYLQDYDATPADMHKLSVWFADLMGKSTISDLELDELRMLMYPAYVFNHAQAFAAITKRLAYEVSRQISEINPTEYRQLHLDGNVLGALNGAKGNLKTKLRDKLEFPFEKLSEQVCPCTDATVVSFYKALNTMRFWKITEFKYKPMREILNMPAFINFSVDMSPTACMKCYEAVSALSIQKVRWQMAKDFHGLCLDCMQLTKTGSVHQDYWMRDLLGKWDLGCRITHGERTWNFSFMGRKTDMGKYQKAKKNKEDNPKELEGFVGKALVEKLIWWRNCDFCNRCLG